MKTLAWTLIIAFLPLHPLFAQNQAASQQQAQADNEPVMFTLTIDEEMIKALREGQSLMSTIPASIRGKVDRIRIEFKPSAAAAPASPSPQNINSILKGNSPIVPPNRTGDNQFGQPTGFNASQPPPLGAPNLNSGLDRSSGGAKQDFTAPNLSDSIWNRGSTSASRSPSTLTPIDQSTRGWLFQNRSDSNAITSNNAERGGIQTSKTSAYNYPMNRTSFDDPPRADGLYSGPPVLSRSLPALDTATSSPGIAASSPMADNTPAVGANQVLSKLPAGDSSGQQPLAASDPTASRTQVYMFMLLLCSLGLNVYLGWISRGFYVRYQELAEELRDTFTPSSAA